MTYSTQEGNILKTNKDFESHIYLNIPLDVEFIEDSSVLTTGLIQEFTDKYIKINDHAYNRETHVFVSRPYAEL